MDDKRIIRPANPSVFRVSDTYHQLYIDYFYDSEDYIETDSSVDHVEADNSLDYVETDSSVEWLWQKDLLSDTSKMIMKEK